MSLDDSIASLVPSVNRLLSISSANLRHHHVSISLGGYGCEAA
jgi:hypothetical protein